MTRPSRSRCTTAKDWVYGGSLAALLPTMRAQATKRPSPTSISSSRLTVSRSQILECLELEPLALEHGAALVVGSGLSPPPLEPPRPGGACLPPPLAELEAELGQAGALLPPEPLAHGGHDRPLLGDTSLGGLLVERLAAAPAARPRRMIPGLVGRAGESRLLGMACFGMGDQRGEAIGHAGGGLAGRLPGRHSIGAGDEPERLLERVQLLARPLGRRDLLDRRDRLLRHAARLLRLSAALLLDAFRATVRLEPALNRRRGDLEGIKPELAGGGGLRRFLRGVAALE